MEVFVYIMCALISLLLISLIFLRESNGIVIPGPKGLPVIGCLFDFSIKSMHTKFMEYAGKYGDIVRINILGNNLITLNSVELVQKAFTDDRYKTHLNDRPSTFIGKHVGYGNKGIVLTRDGNSTLHNELRKLFTRGFRVYGDGIKVFEDKVLHEIVNMKSQIKEFGDVEFDLVFVLRRSLSNLLSVFLSGEPINDCGDVDIFWDFSQTLAFMFTPKANAVYTLAPFMRFLPGIYRDNFQRILAARERIHEKYLFRIKETHERGKVRGYIDFLLEEQANQLETGNDVLLTDDTVKAMLQDMVPTGLITTLSTLSNLFLCLLNHPNCQRKAQEELNKVVGNKRLPSLDDRRNCPFLEALVMETLRYLTTAPIGAPHVTERSLQFEGFIIPAKSNVFANLWYIHHDERIWGDPWTFRPERFLDEKGQLLERGHLFRKSLIPFGVGRRQCIGETFARSRIFLYTASLLQQWTFVPSPGKVGTCDPRKGDFEIDTVIRKESLFCTVKGTEACV
ncbi:cytochrome P450 1A1-like isoform X2 [Mercenaria mercenaria]|uniref:cytochrome P450 1A1-like isoform X2 n=1 Tax=Mercenaria mercenaria TaxID=6596 RepID=UPI00234F06B2|nr:cytochrome P450 1A1-like isoform X2 [Mercenaria mercenaria]